MSRRKKFIVAVAVSSHLVNLVWIAGVSWMLIDFVRSKVTSDAPNWHDLSLSSLEQMASVDLQRSPLGRVVMGDAMDDYTRVRAPDELRGKFRPSLIGRDGAPKAIDEADATLLRTPELRRLAEIFVRGTRRDRVGFSTQLSGPKLLRTARALSAAAVLDAREGRVDDAWLKAVALTRAGQDYLGNAALIDQMLAATQSADARRLLAYLVATTDSPPSHWRSDIEALVAHQPADDEIAARLVAGEARWFLASRESVAPAEQRFLWKDHFEPALDLASAFNDARPAPTATKALCAAHWNVNMRCEIIHLAALEHAELGSQLTDLAAALEQ